jgi:protein FrlC
MMGHPALDQVCGSNLAYQHHTLERCLADMVELGRREVELWGVAPHLYIPKISNVEVMKVRKLLRERGLTVACLTPEQVAYPVNIASGADPLGEASLQLILRAAEEWASKFGVSCVLCLDAFVDAARNLDMSAM